MKFEYFGDSFDIVKHHLIASLQSMGPWAIHPMFTEAPCSEFAEDFSTFLGAPLVSLEVLESTTNRTDYFAPCVEFHNLLLDPNTGLKFSATDRSPHHLLATDLLRIVKERPRSRLTIVYDQSLSRGSEPEDLQAKMERLSAEGLHGFAYWSHACFLFVSREPSTLEHARDLLFGRGKLPGKRIVPNSQVAAI